jgi:hypothetical protein
MMGLGRKITAYDLEARRRAGIPPHLVLLPESELARLAGVSRTWVRKAIARGLNITPRNTWPATTPWLAEQCRKHSILRLRLKEALRNRHQSPLHAIFFERIRT